MGRAPQSAAWHHPRAEVALGARVETCGVPGDVSFGELLRSYRSAAGLSQEGLAERARLSAGAISALERSARKAPQHQTLGLLVEALRLGQHERFQLETAATQGRHRRPRDGPAAAIERTLDNLPNLLTSFHGREREVADLQALVRSRRIITLLGAGGMGKTRLALEVARLQARARSFADGVWFVELAQFRTLPFVASAIAQVLSVREHLDRQPIASLIDAIAPKKLLIILDNCEHVVDECARVIEQICRSCEGVTVIATSRETLRLDGECVIRVEPLSLEGKVGAGPAVQLLVDRLVDADFVRFSSMTAADRASAATICRHLDCIPLALELAAARARDLSLTQLIAGLEQRFTLLSHGLRTASPRQQTLAGMIDWSFALLEPREQRFFRRLGLFQSAFVSEAAVDICSDSGYAEARDALGALIAKSLIDVVEDRAGSLRYRLLETVRRYAIERLQESGEYDHFAERFSRYFRSLAGEADATYGRIPHRTFLASVEPNLDNFRAALDWTLAQRKDPVLGAELAGALGWVYRQTSLFAEGTYWCQSALSENPVLDWRTHGRLQMALSFFAFNLGELSRALETAERATTIYDGAAASSELSWALTQQGYCLYLLGRTGESRTVIAQAVIVARSQSDPLRLAGALNAFALTIPVELASQRFAPLEEAIRCYRAAGDESAIVPLANLAEAHFAAGDLNAAFARGCEAVDVTRNNHDRTNLASALTNLAAYALAVDDVDAAARFALEGLSLVRDIGPTMNAMLVFQHLGSVSARRGEFIRAARLTGAADRLYRDFGLKREFTEQSLLDRTLCEIRTTLADDELRLHLQAGEMLLFEHAVREALDGPR